MFNLENLTETQEYKMYGLEREGKSRFLVSYSGRYHRYEEIENTNDFFKAVEAIRNHFKRLIEEYPSSISDIDVENGIDCYEIIDLTETDSTENIIRISLQEILKINFILQILDKSKKRVNKKNEQK